MPKKKVVTVPETTSEVRPTRIFISESQVTGLGSLATNNQVAHQNDSTATDVRRAQGGFQLAPRGNGHVRGDAVGATVTATPLMMPIIR